MAKSTREASSKSEQKTFEESITATSSPASASGPTLSPKQAGPKRSKSGQVRARVSRSLFPENDDLHPMNVTCGPPGSISSESADPQSFSESKSPAVAAETERKCAGCGIVKPLSEFYKNQPSIGGGYRTKCKACCRAKSSDWRSRPGAKARVSASHVAYRRKNRARTLCFLAKYRAALKGLEYSLDEHREELQRVIDAGVCQVTGLPLNLDGGKTWDSPSLDRIDPTKGYTRENVRIVLYSVNVMANLWGENKILEIARAIQSIRRARSETLSMKIAEKICSQTDLLGSASFRLTWKTRFTPSGRLIPALRPDRERASTHLRNSGV